MLFHLVSDLVGDGPFIEGLRAVLGNQLQALTEILLHQPVALFQRLAVLPEDRFTVFMLRDHFAAIGLQIVRQRIVNDKALFCQLNRRADHFVQRHGAVLFQGEGETGDAAWRAGGQMRSQ